MEVKISIIIPMYNVADYVTRCIESLEQQDIPHSDYEIICINDGSPDNCKEIVENLQKRYPNIILLNQENQGVSMARNNGVAIAKGKYILPIDPDDYVLNNSFKSIITKLESEEPEVLYLSFDFFDKNSKIIWSTNYEKLESKSFKGNEAYFVSREFGTLDPDRSWAILFSRNFLIENKINYPKDVPYLEDGLFIGKVMSVANKVSFDTTKFYQRTTRIGSATNSKLFYSKFSADGFFNAIEDLYVFKKKLNKNKVDESLIYHLHSKFLLHLLAPSATNFNYKEYKKITAQIKQKNMGLTTYQGLSNVFKRLLKIYNFSEIFFFLYYPFYVKFRTIKKNNIK